MMVDVVGDIDDRFDYHCPINGFLLVAAIINQIDSNYTQHISHLGILFIQRYSDIKIVSRRQKVFVMHKVCTKGE